jgi:hypothetical protein
MGGEEFLMSLPDLFGQSRVLGSGLYLLQLLFGGAIEGLILNDLSCVLVCFRGEYSENSFWGKEIDRQYQVEYTATVEIVM